MNNSNYFVATLMSGEEIDFNKICTEVNYSDTTMVVFENKFDDNSYYTLAIIPKNNIKYIMAKGE